VTYVRACVGLPVTILDKSVVLEKLWNSSGSTINDVPDTQGPLPGVLGFSRHDNLYQEGASEDDKLRPSEQPKHSRHTDTDENSRPVHYNSVMSNSDLRYDNQIKEKHCRKRNESQISFVELMDKISDLSITATPCKGRHPPNTADPMTKMESNKLREVIDLCEEIADDNGGNECERNSVPGSPEEDDDNFQLPALSTMRETLMLQSGCRITSGIICSDDEEEEFEPFHKVPPRTAASADNQESVMAPCNAGELNRFINMSFPSSPATNTSTNKVLAEVTHATPVISQRPPVMHAMEQPPSFQCDLEDDSCFLDDVELEYFEANTDETHVTAAFSIANSCECNNSSNKDMAEEMGAGQQGPDVFVAHLEYDEGESGYNIPVPDTSEPTDSEKLSEKRLLSRGPPPVHKTSLSRCRNDDEVEKMLGVPIATDVVGSYQMGNSASFDEITEKFMSDNVFVNLKVDVVIDDGFGSSMKPYQEILNFESSAAQEAQVEYDFSNTDSSSVAEDAGDSDHKPSTLVPTGNYGSEIPNNELNSLKAGASEQGLPERGSHGFDVDDGHGHLFHKRDESGFTAFIIDLDDEDENEDDGGRRNSKKIAVHQEPQTEEQVIWLRRVSDVGSQVCSIADGDHSSPPTYAVELENDDDDISEGIEILVVHQEYQTIPVDEVAYIESAVDREMDVYSVDDSEHRSSPTFAVELEDEDDECDDDDDDDDLDVSKSNEILFMHQECQTIPVEEVAYAKAGLVVGIDIHSVDDSEHRSSPTFAVVLEDDDDEYDNGDDNDYHGVSESNEIIVVHQEFGDEIDTDSTESDVSANAKHQGMQAAHSSEKAYVPTDTHQTDTRSVCNDDHSELVRQPVIDQASIDKDIFVQSKGILTNANQTQAELERSGDVYRTDHENPAECSAFVVELEDESDGDSFTNQQSVLGFAEDISIQAVVATPRRPERYEEAGLGADEGCQFACELDNRFVSERHRGRSCGRGRKDAVGSKVAIAEETYLDADHAYILEEYIFQ
jgi:hypothetical protein